MVNYELITLPDVLAAAISLSMPMASKAVIRSAQDALGELFNQTLNISALILSTPCIW